MMTYGNKIIHLFKLGTFVLGLSSVAFGSAQAQNAIPRSTTELPVVEVKPIDPFEPSIIIDFPEEMRVFVSNLSSFARSVNPSFVVLAKDGLSLVNKVNPTNATDMFPANAYTRSLDGVLETNLLDETVTTPEGKPDPDLMAKLQFKQSNLATAADSRLKVFNMEFSTDSGTIDKLYADSASKGFVPFVAEGPALATIPKSPSSIYKANAASILTAADMKNYLYMSNSQGFGRTSDLILALRKTNYDALIIDIFHGKSPLTKADVKLLKYKHLGSRRLVLAEIDISSASVFQYFWSSDWRVGNPPFLYAPYKKDSDRFRTAYWDPEWQALISGNAQSYLYGIIDLGFDGVVFKGLNAWQFYSSGGEIE